MNRHRVIELADEESTGRCGTAREIDAVDPPLTGTHRGHAASAELPKTVEHPAIRRFGEDAFGEHGMET